MGKAMRQAVEDMEGLDPKEKMRVEYFTRQIMDMFSPANFLGTNPEALAKAVETDGESLVRCLENLARDIDEFREALTYFDIAVQNVYYADVEGNIAWITTSEKPLREDLANFTIDGLPPWFIRDGTGYGGHWGQEPILGQWGVEMIAPHHK